MTGRSDHTLFHGVAAALVLSLCGAALLALLTPIAGSAAALRAVVAALGLAYVLYLLARSAERTGRVTSVVLWTAASAAVWLSEPPLGAYVLLHAGMIWLIRSLYHHSSALAALADLGLTALAVAFAAWAIGRSDSAWLALWCFFLVQAFFVWLPASIAGGGRQRTSDDEHETFDHAHRAGEAALRRLASARVNHTR